MRINARLDDSYEEKFVQAESINNKNRSEIVKEALDLYFSTNDEQIHNKAHSNNNAILGLLSGIGKGYKDDSIEYKRHVAEYLDKKYPISKS